MAKNILRKFNLVVWQKHCQMKFRQYFFGAFMNFSRERWFCQSDKERAADIVQGACGCHGIPPQHGHCMWIFFSLPHYISQNNSLPMLRFQTFPCDALNDALDHEEFISSTQTFLCDALNDALDHEEYISSTQTFPCDAPNDSLDHEEYISWTQTFPCDAPNDAFDHEEYIS